MTGTSEPSPIKSVSRSTGEMLLVQLLLCYVSVYFCFMTGIRVSGLILPGSMIIGCLVSASTCSNVSTYWRSSILTLCIWAISIIIGSFAVDYSFDGNGYHQQIVAALCDGWHVGEDEVKGLPLALWCMHYAKGIEIAEAAVVACTGILESGKSINLVLFSAAGLLIYAFIRDRFPHLSRRKSAICSLVAVCNPVVLCQIPTFYIDYAKYIYTSLSIVFLFDITSKPKYCWNYLLLAVITCMAVTTKFNAFFEEGIVYFAALIWLMYLGKWNIVGKITICGAVATVVSVLILGYHPYVTNLIEAGHPLYPLMGNGSIDIMTTNTPDIFVGHNRLYTFVRSLFSVELLSVDTRTGGFGPLMPLMLIISVWALWKKRHFERGIVIYISAWALASCFFFEQSWWARYNSQLWLIVALGTILLFSSPDNPRWLYRLQTGLVMFTAAVCIMSGLVRSYRCYCMRRAITTEIRGREVRVISLSESFRRQLEERGIIAVPTTIDDSVGVRVPYYGYVSEPENYPVLLLDDSTRTSILRRLENTPFTYSANFDPKVTDK